MKVKLPKNSGSNMNNLQDLAKKAQKMQEDMDKATKELETKTYTSTVGGGMVAVTVTGKPEVVSIKIDPEVINRDEVEILTDMLIAGINESLKEAITEKENVMQSISGQMNIPNIF